MKPQSVMPEEAEFVMHGSPSFSPTDAADVMNDEPAPPTEIVLDDTSVRPLSAGPIETDAAELRESEGEEKCR